MSSTTLLPVERVIADAGLRADGGTLALSVRLPWYRALPLSTVLIEGLSVDGQPVDLAQVQFTLDGQSWPLAALADETHRFWFVLDNAVLSFAWDGAVAGREYDVSATISIFPPYIPGMKRAHCERTILVAS